MSTSMNMRKKPSPPGPHPQPFPRSGIMRSTASAGEGSYLVAAWGPIAGAMGYSLSLLRSRLGCGCHGVAAESSPRRQPWERKAQLIFKPR